MPPDSPPARPGSSAPLTKRVQATLAAARRQWSTGSATLVPLRGGPGKKAAAKAAPKPAGTGGPQSGAAAALAVPSAADVRAARALPGDRLLEKPVFVLSSIRSGSTLLRVLLNAHSEIYAPHELHLTGLGVKLRGRYVTKAMTELGLDEDSLQFLLWDRLLHREMLRHGKSVLANKTPSDALMWRRVAQCWPDVRFIFLLRHPAAITDSWHRARKEWSRDQAAVDVLRYMDAVEDAREQHGGLSVRYEDITIDPEREMRRVCEFIGVEYEPGMIDYGAAEDNKGAYRAGLGDWSQRIKSGKVQPIERMPDPEDVPDALLDISKKWGYLTDGG